MADQPVNFDVSNLEGLGKILAEQQSLRDLATRAAEHREKVTEVYNRVVQDYERRIALLDEQAQRLRAQVREDFDRLDAVFSSSRQALEQARLDLQESEFRREIGEFSADEFRRRQAEIEKSIAEKQGELDRLGELRGRFVAILPAHQPATQESAKATPVIPLPPPKPIAPPAPPSEPAVAPPPVPVPEPPPVATKAPATLAGPVAAGVGETMVMPPPGSAVFRMPPMPAAGDEGATQILGGPPSGMPDSPEAFATVAIAAAMLVEEKSGSGTVQHRLGMLTTIGRTPDNQIVVPSREASRKHAEVVLGQDGYVLRDLGSPNGTFVNDKKITEHRLQDGDRVKLAGVSFVFKAK